MGLLRSVPASAPPRFFVEPKTVRGNAWVEAVDLLAALGLVLDDWQELIMQASLGERTDGTWAAKRVGLSIPRQNGKSQMIVARALVGVLLFGERHVVVSAHLQDTARETFGKFMELIEASPELEAQLRGGKVEKGVLQAFQRETIYFANGAKIQFKARTASGGRGFSADLLMLDEAQILKDTAWASIVSTMSARENPQLWVMGTPPTPLDEGEVFTRFRQTAVEGKTTSVTYVEWSADPDDDPASEATLAKANPAWYTRINHDVVQGELETYDPEQFALERLGIWALGGSKPRVIDRKAWAARAIDATLAPSEGPRAIGVKFSPDGRRVGVSVAVSPEGGTAHVEAFPPSPTGPGTTELANWIAERWTTYARIVIDGKSGAQDLAQMLRKRSIPTGRVIMAQSDKAIAANSGFKRMVEDGTLTHIDQEGLTASVNCATRRDIGVYGGWGFEPATPDGDVLPIESAALAVYGALLKSQKISSNDDGVRSGRRVSEGRRVSTGRRVSSR